MPQAMPETLRERTDLYSDLRRKQTTWQVTVVSVDPDQAAAPSKWVCSELGQRMLILGHSYLSSACGIQVSCSLLDAQCLGKNKPPGAGLAPGRTEPTQAIPQPLALLEGGRQWKGPGVIF